MKSGPASLGKHTRRASLGRKVKITTFQAKGAICLVFSDFILTYMCDSMVLYKDFLSKASLAEYFCNHHNTM